MAANPGAHIRAFPDTSFIHFWHRTGVSGMPVAHLSVTIITSRAVRPHPMCAGSGPASRLMMRAAAVKDQLDVADSPCIVDLRQVGFPATPKPVAAPDGESILGLLMGMEFPETARKG
jgi:hypothetical protein